MGGSQQSTLEPMQNDQNIFYARCRRGNEVEPPPTLPKNIERVNSIKALGVTISSQLSVSRQVTSYYISELMRISTVRLTNSQGSWNAPRLPA